MRVAARAAVLLMDLGEWCFDNPGITAILLVVLFLGVIALVESRRKEVRFGHPE